LRRLTAAALESRPDEETFAGVLAVRKVTVPAIFLNSSVRSLRCFNIVSFGCGLKSCSPTSRVLRETNGVSGFERSPERFRFSEQGLHFGGICSGGSRAVLIQILFHVGPSRSDILHDLVIRSALLGESRGHGKNPGDSDRDPKKSSIHFPSLYGVTVIVPSIPYMPCVSQKYWYFPGTVNV
jgi:hypothetical protein